MIGYSISRSVPLNRGNQHRLQILSQESRLGFLVPVVVQLLGVRRYELVLPSSQ